MEKWKVRTTKEELERLFILDESGFSKAVDEFIEESQRQYNAHLIIKYLRGRGII